MKQTIELEVLPIEYITIKSPIEWLDDDEDIASLAAYNRAETIYIINTMKEKE